MTDEIDLTSPDDADWIAAGRADQDEVDEESAACDEQDDPDADA